MRGLDGLGAGVHRQHHVLAAQLGELRAERAELVVVERAAGEGEPVELRLAAAISVRVAVAEVERRVAGQHVEVAVALDVGDPGAFGARRRRPAGDGSCARCSDRRARSGPRTRAVPRGARPIRRRHRRGLQPSPSVEPPWGRHGRAPRTPQACYRPRSAHAPAERRMVVGRTARLALRWVGALRVALAEPTSGVGIPGAWSSASGTGPEGTP